MIRKLCTALLMLTFAAASSFAGTLEPFDAGAFAEASSANKIVVIHVSGDECAECGQQKDILTGLSMEAAMSHVQFMQADFGKDKEFLSANNVVKTSVIIVFKGGQEVERLIDVTDRDAIETRVKAAIV